MIIGQVAVMEKQHEDAQPGSLVLHGHECQLTWRVHWIFQHLWQVYKL